MSRLLLIGLVVLGIAGCASTDTSSAPPSVDVTGAWAGTWAYTQATLGGGQIELTLKQDGGKFSGNATITGTPINRNGPVSGLVSGNEVRIMYPSSVTGRLTVQDNPNANCKACVIAGTLDGLNPANLTMTKK